MNHSIRQVIMQRMIFGWIAIGTIAVLSIPFIAMQFDATVEWSVFDFAIMAILIFGAGSMYVLAARTIQDKYLVPLAIAFLVAFIYIWAELAVGVFTSIGS